MASRLSKFCVSRFVKVDNEWAEIKKLFYLSEVEQMMSYLVELSKTCSKCTVTFVKEFTEEVSK